MNNFLPGLSRFVLAALCMPVAVSVQAAVVMLPDATYHADLNFPLPAEHLSTVGSKAPTGPCSRAPGSTGATSRHRPARRTG